MSYNPFLSVKELGDNEANDKENCAWVSGYNKVKHGGIHFDIA